MGLAQVLVLGGGTASITATIVPATVRVPLLFTVYAVIPPGEDGAEVPLFAINTASALGVMSIESRGIARDYRVTVQSERTAAQIDRVGLNRSVSLGRKPKIAGSACS